MADPDRTLEVLINLIDDEIKFTQPRISGGEKPHSFDTTAVYLSVADRGRGIRRQIWI